MNERQIIRSLLVGILIAATAGCSSAGKVGGGDHSPPGCSPVAQGWIDQLDMPAGSYVYVDSGTASNGHAAWVVGKEDGAVWATDVDPSTTPSGGGLIAPLNSQARQESDVGAALSDEAIANLFPDASADAVANC